MSTAESSTPAGTVMPILVEPELQTTRTVFALELGGRNVYCVSPACVSALTARGWKLSDPNQLAILVKELARGPSPPTHDPSDHF